MVEEIDLSKDIVDWERVLKNDERFFITRILAFFATANGIINENPLVRFATDIGLPEARCFYGFQMMMWVKHISHQSRIWFECQGKHSRGDLYFPHHDVNCKRRGTSKSLWGCNRRSNHISQGSMVLKMDIQRYAIYHSSCCVCSGWGYIFFFIFCFHLLA